MHLRLVRVAERLSKCRESSRQASWRAAKFGALSFCLLILACTTAVAAPGDFLYKVSSPEPQGGGGFGSVISAVDGDLLIGAPTLSVGGGAFGRAYLFDGQTGKLKVTFNNPEPTDIDNFGESLAGGDGRVFISTDGVVPRVYAFDTKTGRSLFTIHEPLLPGGSNFGTDLAYGSGSLVVSNPSYSEPFRNVGRAYLFDGMTGRLEHVLANPEPKSGDAFGISDSLAVYGNRVVVGANADDLPGDDRPDGDNPGRVWVFDRSTGETEFVLDNPNPDKLSPFFLSDSFGSMVAANENVIAVGARLDDTSGLENSGTVYVFDSTTGALRHSLFGPHAAVRDDFGFALAVSEDGNVLAGSRRTSVGAIENAGHAYLFDDLTGNVLLDFTSPEPSPSSFFGWSVAAFDNRVAVGDLRGNVYVFESIPEPSTLVLTGSLGVAAFAARQIRVFRGGRLRMRKTRGSP